MFHNHNYFVLLFIDVKAEFLFHHESNIRSSNLRKNISIIIQELFVNFMLVLPVKVYNQLSETPLHPKNGYTVYSGA